MPVLLPIPQFEPVKQPSREQRTGQPSTPATSGRVGLQRYYDALFAAYGPQHWWPGRTRFEVIVGAILVQNTSWTNVASAIEKLRREKLLTPLAIERVSTPRLARLIRSSGYFRQKAKKLKALVRFLRREYQGSLAKLFRGPTEALRQQLLSVHGIGPETADSILLYAGNHPVFVVDAYTRRMLERHGLAHSELDYEQVRQFFQSNLTPDAALYNEFHALIVHIGKHFCRPREPRCAECPLGEFLPVQGPAGFANAARGPQLRPSLASGSGPAFIDQNPQGSRDCALRDRNAGAPEGNAVV